MEYKFKDHEGYIEWCRLPLLDSDSCQEKFLGKRSFATSGYTWHALDGKVLCRREDGKIWDVKEGENWDWSFVPVTDDLLIKEDDKEDRQEEIENHADLETDQYGNIIGDDESFADDEDKETTNVLWLSNHPCSGEQENNLNKLFGTFRIDELPSEGKKIWGNVNPHIDMYDCQVLFNAAVETVHSGNLSDYDIIVVMGELSLCLTAVQLAVVHNISIYTPTTERRSVERIESNGSVTKTNVFKHCQLRCLHCSQ